MWEVVGGDRKREEMGATDSGCADISRPRPADGCTVGSDYTL